MVENTDNMKIIISKSKLEMIPQVMQPAMYSKWWKLFPAMQKIQCSLLNLMKSLYMKKFIIKIAKETIKELA
jgi:hypothetical protein